MDITKEKLIELGFEENKQVDNNSFFSKEMEDYIDIWVDFSSNCIISIATKNIFGNGYTETPVRNCNSMTRLTTLIKLFSFEL